MNCRRKNCRIVEKPRNELGREDLGKKGLGKEEGTGKEETEKEGKGIAKVGIVENLGGLGKKELMKNCGQRNWESRTFRRKDCRKRSKFRARQNGGIDRKGGSSEGYVR